MKSFFCPLTFALQIFILQYMPAQLTEIKFRLIIFWGGTKSL